MPRPATLAAWLALLLLASAACRRAGAGGSGPAPVTPAARLVAPERVQYAAQVVATGTLRPRQQAQLAFVVAGTLHRIAVKRGQAVRERETLLELDADAARAALAQAEAGVGAARAQLALAEDALARLEAIRGREGGVTDSQLVQSRGQRDLARAQLLGAEAQRESARVNLDRQTLRAPFAGVVTKVPDGVGVAVSANLSLVALESTRQLVLDTSLTQEEAAELPAGAKAEVTVTASGARTEEATVSVVVPTVEGSTNRVPIEIAVPNADGRFLAHAFARARLPSGAPRDALKVPAASLVQREGVFSVWIADADGRGRALPVTVLAQEGDSAVVEPAKPGFPAGARVVDLPPLGIADGLRLAEVTR